MSAKARKDKSYRLVYLFLFQSQQITWTGRSQRIHTIPNMEHAQQETSIK
jgi:hypothetical protein